MTEETKKEAAGETPPKPKRNKMVNVYNKHRFRSLHLGGGKKIGPGQSGKIPYGIYEKVKDYGWIARAERGDVV